MPRGNITIADFSGGGRKATTAALWQYDYGQILQFSGIEGLPSAYEVHFSNDRIAGEAITQIGNEHGVAIPDEYFLSGKPIFAWIFLHAGANDGETEYQVTIPINKCSRPADQPPTPVERSVITQAIAALNVAVTRSEEAAERSEQMAAVAGYMTMELDENGHLIFTKTPGVAVDFEIYDGHLYAEVR